MTLIHPAHQRGRTEALAVLRSCLHAVAHIMSVAAILILLLTRRNR